MKRKRARTTINNFISVPYLIYIFSFLSAFALIGLGLFCIDVQNNWHDIVLNFGYGIFGSTFVALLVDIGATKRQKHQDAKVYAILRTDLKVNISSLVYLRNRYSDTVGERYKNVSYISWLKKAGNMYALSDDGAEHHTILEEFKQMLREIKASADALKIGLYSNLNNEAFSYHFNLGVSKITFLCDNSLKAVDNNDYNKFFFSLECLFESIGDLYPEFKSKLTFDSKTEEDK